MAPQRLEKIGSAPGNGMGSEALKSLDAELKSVPVFRHPNAAANIRFAEAPKVLAAPGYFAAACSGGRSPRPLSAPGAQFKSERIA